MKLGSATSWLLALVLIGSSLIACKRHKAGASTSSGAVRFEGAGVALNPGEQWKQVRSEDPRSGICGKLCLPILEGEGNYQGGAIEVYAAAAEKSSPKAWAAKLRAQLEQQSDVLRTSLKQEDFNAESGIGGVHLSYNTKIETNGRKWLNRRHLYLIRNNQGTCVGVCYVVVANRDTEVVHQMIRNTLVLQ